MSKEDNGGAAFPSPGVVMPDGTQQGAYDGMTLRDYFAAQSVAAIIGEMELSPWDPAEASAMMAYRIADAMLAARQK